MAKDLKVGDCLLTAHGRGAVARATRTPVVDGDVTYTVVVADADVIAIGGVFAHTALGHTHGMGEKLAPRSRAMQKRDQRLLKEMQEKKELATAFKERERLQNKDRGNSEKKMDRMGASNTKKTVKKEATSSDKHDAKPATDNANVRKSIDMRHAKKRQVVKSSDGRFLRVEVAQNGGDKKKKGRIAKQDDGRFLRIMSFM
jgi:hypothetical protein